MDKPMNESSNLSTDVVSDERLPTTDSAPRTEMEVTRRQVLSGIGAAAAVAAAGMAVPARATRGTAIPPVETISSATFSATSGIALQAPPTTAPGILVLLTLYGGNDGLDTVVPYSSSVYQAARGELAVRPEQVLKLDSELGLHPAMVGMKGFWDRKKLAIIQGVGYANPNRSHFRSMDIWQSGVSDQYEVSGWLGRWQDATSTDPLRMLSIGPSVPRALVGLKGGGGSALPNGQVALPGGVGVTNAFVELGKGTAGSELGVWGAKVGASVTNLARVVDQLGPVLKAGSQAAVSTSLEGGAAANGDNDNVLASQLDDVATLIRGGAPTRVYSVSLGGFDNHATEREQHARLLSIVDTALSDFLTKLSSDPRAAAVTILVYSEFGRRVQANLSVGTDHGTAAPVLVVGPKVKGGFYGETPSLTNLDQGDLRFTTDFRAVYASVLANVLGVDPSVSLGSNSPAPIPFMS